MHNKEAARRWEAQTGTGEEAEAVCRRGTGSQEKLAARSNEQSHLRKMWFFLLRSQHPAQTPHGQFCLVGDWKQLCFLSLWLARKRPGYGGCFKAATALLGT